MTVTDTPLTEADKKEKHKAACRKYYEEHRQVLAEKARERYRRMKEQNAEEYKQVCERMRAYRKLHYQRQRAAAAQTPDSTSALLIHAN